MPAKNGRILGNLDFGVVDSSPLRPSLFAGILQPQIAPQRPIKLTICAAISSRKRYESQYGPSFQ